MSHYPQIARVDIVQFKRGRNVPACTVELEWTGSGESKPLPHQVNISGAKRNQHTSIYLRCYPQAVDEFYFCAHMHVHVYIFEFSFHYYSCYQILLQSSPPVLQGNECIVHI